MGRTVRFWRYSAPILLVICVVAAFLPTYIALSDRVWNSDEGSHGPLILAAALWFTWADRERYRDCLGSGASRWGWPVLVLGLSMLVIGRSQSFLSVEVLAQLPVLAGCLLLLGGWPMLRIGATPLVFLLFVVPPPGSLIDTATMPLKSLISNVVVQALYWAGLPVAQSGVVIMIGPYQLLVKTACAGMNSIFTLSAVGLLYLRLHSNPTLLRKIVLTASILPIAVGANMIRVMSLVLIAYYDHLDAIEGSYHELTGIFLFVVALLLFFAVDQGVSLVETIAHRLFQAHPHTPVMRDRAA